MSVIHTPNRPQPHPGHEHGHDGECCIVAGPFDHLSYLYGQMLTPSHLQRAQRSVYEKLKLHNRCLHGWGVVCGLAVSAVPMEKECPPEGAECPPEERAAPGEREGPEKSEEQEVVAAEEQAASKVPPERPVDPCALPKTELRVGCGVAIDCPGNDLVVREPLTIDLYAALSPADRKVVDDDQAHTLWVSLCFRSYGIERVRGMTPDDCGGGSAAFWAFQREGACVRVTLERPEHTDACETCCTCCDSECVLLARVDDYRRGRRVGRIDDSVRRPLSRYVPTVVAGVGWHHGATYSSDDVDDLLWTTGLKVRFSRPVHAETLTDGVCDVYVHRRHNQDVWVMDGTLEVGTGMVSELVYRGDEDHRENIDPRDRIVFVLRGDLVLDHCCVPVDGNHVGGLVPPLAGTAAKPLRVRPKLACADWPRRIGPWASGNGVPGGTFESWFFAEEPPDQKPGKKGRQP